MERFCCRERASCQHCSQGDGTSVINTGHFPPAQRGTGPWHILRSQVSDIQYISILYTPRYGFVELLLARLHKTTRWSWIKVVRTGSGPRKEPLACGADVETEDGPLRSTTSALQVQFTSRRFLFNNACCSRRLPAVSGDLIRATSFLVLIIEKHESDDLPSKPSILTAASKDNRSRVWVGLKLSGWD